MGIALAALAVAVALFVVLRDDDRSEPTPPVTQEAAPAPDEGREASEPDVPVIVIRGGEPVGGVAELEFRRGDRVRFAVRSDAGDEIHVHGYDVYRDVEAGGRTEVGFPAEFDGVYEVELHDAGAEIAQITIRP